MISTSVQEEIYCTSLPSGYNTHKAMQITSGRPLGNAPNCTFTLIRSRITIKWDTSKLISHLRKLISATEFKKKKFKKLPSNDHFTNLFLTTEHYKLTIVGIARCKLWDVNVWFWEKSSGVAAYSQRRETNLLLNMRYLTLTVLIYFLNVSLVAQT